MKITRSWSLSLAVLICLLLTAAVHAQEEKEPSAIWADFANAIKQDQPEATRQASVDLLKNSRLVDDHKFIALIDGDPDHDATFLQGIQNEKTRDSSMRVLERYVAAKTAPKISPIWEDFNHYVRIARPDAALSSANDLLSQLAPTVTAVVSPAIAQAGGEALMSRLQDQTLLAVVESKEFPDFDLTLTRAARTQTLRDISLKISQRIQEARIKRSRDHERIIADILSLGEGDRANVNAVERLKAAGQFAAPELLAALLDEKRANLQPFVLAAMVSVGRPMVYPLSVALPNLEPVPQGQVAQVLAEIGYPRALPYIKLAIDDPKADPNTAAILEAAYKQLSHTQQLPKNVSAAELFLTMATNYYAAGSAGETLMGFDAAAGKGVVWNYDRTAGLIDNRVSATIFPDVLAMRAARQALVLNPQLDPALSLWLAANLRRANRLPAGEMDPSYPAGMQPPSFYLEMAGPLRQHDVLHRALEDGDTALALDAIAGLSQTAGTDALVNREGAAQPLLRALVYPDRRVRFAAAFALTNAQPKTEFPGSFRVVPVLSEAVRQSNVRYAVVIGKDQPSMNRLSGIVAELGYKPLVGVTLAEVSEAVNAGPGVDLIVTDQSLEQVTNIYHETTHDYKLAAVPIVALVSPGDQIELNRRFDRDPRMHAASMSNDPKELKAALDATAQSYAGAAITADEAKAYAINSLRLLKQIAMSSANVFNLRDAEPALIQSLGDKRPEVVEGAAQVLALLDTGDSQRAVADAALDISRTDEMRIHLLGSLALSATRMGSQLNDVELGKILDLVKTQSGDLALAAARAHGALTLPTADVVDLLGVTTKK